MTREELLNRISIDPNICFGKPCIRGRRIWVSLILDLLASGMTHKQIRAEYDLSEEDILACLAYGDEHPPDPTADAGEPTENRR